MLVGAKSAACVFLVYLREVASRSLSQWGLVLTAVCYVMGSFLPWCLVFLRLRSLPFHMGRVARVSDASCVRSGAGLCTGPGARLIHANQ